MPSFSQLVAGLLNATMENNASLVSAKFDFSLMRVDAPAEFAALGSALSTKRREDAEIGPIHRIARRLAGLFEQLLPSSPRLVAAYGERVSSIVSKPSINPSATARDGPFAAFVGVDGTALWAAATSGTPAIGVYLLACLLARAWDAKMAVSIWVELVESRKKEIREGFQVNRNIPEATFMSSLQDITREDLALWDASARAWLRSADQTKQWHLKQLELVTNDAGIKFVGGGTTYCKVLVTWIRAITGMEALLNGQPQEISDASILLAFSAWHLFPDLIVLTNSTTKVPFHDKSFRPSAVGTIGLFPADAKADRGIQWSLTLSHLQNYGPPVEVEGQAESPWITFAQLRLAALGALFYKWRLNHRTYFAAASFISGIWTLLVDTKDRPSDLSVERQFGWLWVLAKASQDLLSAKTKSEALFQDCTRILSFGHRRGWDFIGPGKESYVPFFGLCNKHVLEALKMSNDSDCGIRFMQSIAQASGLTTEDGIIIKGHWNRRETTGHAANIYELVTIVPHEMKMRKRDCEGVNLSRYTAGRWFEVHKAHEPETMGQLTHRQAQCSTPTEFVGSAPNISSMTNFTVLEWPSAPRIFSGMACCASESSAGKDRNEQLGVACSCFEQGHKTAKFYRTVGDWRCGLFLTNDKSLEKTLSVTPEEALQHLRDNCHRETFWSYIASLVKASWSPARGTGAGDSAQATDLGVSIVSAGSVFSSPACKALQSLAVADMIFQDIDTPVVSQRCVLSALHKNLWHSAVETRGHLHSSCNANCTQLVQSTDHECLDIYSRMHTAIPVLPTREAAFACITFFDSGSINVSPAKLANVLAMSSGNSIYVAGIALSDPSEHRSEYDIRHIVGNIGRRGISLLVAPQNPRIRTLGHDYRLVNHAPYDHKREDNFRDTSLHLSFTNWTQPLTTRSEMRTIDQDIYFVESVISVRDRGTWVADLDVLGIDFASLEKLKGEVSCKNNHEQHQSSRMEVDHTSIDSWEEFLDHPTTTGIFRAHGNWAARLAAVSILFQRQMGHCFALLGKESFCLYCMEQARHSMADSIFGQYESRLPQFCLD